MKPKAPLPPPLLLLVAALLLAPLPAALLRARSAPPVARARPLRAADNHVTLTRTREVLERLRAAQPRYAARTPQEAALPLRPEGTEPLRLMRLAGDVWTVDAETPLRLLAREGQDCRVEPLSGQERGQQGWLPCAQVEGGH